MYGCRIPECVEIGQYSMTKDTAEFSQFTDAVACREYTLPRDEEATEPKGWIRGNTKIGPVSEVATCCLHGKYGVEIRIMSMNKDNYHSWVRISHGLNSVVIFLRNLCLSGFLFLSYHPSCPCRISLCLSLFGRLHRLPLNLRRVCFRLKSS